MAGAIPAQSFPAAARRPSVAALTLLAGVAPLATDTYISAMPGMAVALDAPAAVIQLTFTAFLLGLAFGQLVFGSASDGLGRKPFLVLGPIGFTVMSVVCAVAQDAYLLVGARLLQGIAGAAAIVVARAVVSDFFDRESAAKTFALMASVTALAPVAAPILGGLILTVGSWRLIFLVLALIGLLMLAGAVFLVPETLPKERRQSSSFVPTLRRMGALLRNPVFMGVVITGCLTTAGLLTYVAGATFVLNSVYGVTPQLFTLIFAVNSLGLVISSLVFRWLVGRVKVRNLVTYGVSVSASGATVLALLSWFAHPPLWIVWALLTVTVSGVGFLAPGFITLGQRAGAAFAGTAAAVQGFFQFGFGALATPITGLAGYDSLIPMATIMSVMLLAALLLNRILARVQRVALRELD